MAVNPGTFYIPDEYAVVQKPLVRRTAPDLSSVPDLPPKRNQLTSSTSISGTLTNNKPTTKTVSFAEDRDTSAKNKLTTKRVGFADNRDTPGGNKPTTKRVGFQEDTETPGGNKPTTKRVGFTKNPPSQSDTPVVPPRLPPKRGSVNDDIYGRLSDSTSGCSRPTDRIPKDLIRPTSHTSHASPSRQSTSRTSSVDSVSPSPQSTSQTSSVDSVSPSPQSTSQTSSVDSVSPSPQSTSQTSSADYVSPSPQSTSQTSSADYVSPSPQSTSQASSADYASPSGQSDDQFNLPNSTDSVILRRQSSQKPGIPNCVDFQVFLTEHENMLRGVLELSTLHHDVIDKVKLRVVCLFDISGSMMLKCGRSRKHSKLNKLKKMAADLVDVLEEGDDYIGIVAFGEGTRVVCPLTKVDSRSRVNLKEAISLVDKEVDSKTDLVKGVLRAIDLLKSGQEAHDPSYRNAIVVFSDGEINSGEIEPDNVVHAVRQKIRDTNPHPDTPDESLWLSIACVTTGGNVSEAMYLVSKYCGSDAYYYVDSDLDNPEVDMLIPLLLRKSAVAQFVTLGITSGNGATLVAEKCTREHSVRRRREEKKTGKMLYYLHDLPAGSQKHFSIAVDLAHYSRESDSEVICINLEYVDATGETRTVMRTVRFSEALTPLKDPERYDKGVLLGAKADMRNVFQNACRNAADVVQKDPDSSPSEPLNEGKSKIHQLMEHYGRMAKREETKTKVQEFSLALVENLDNLITSMEKSRRGAGHKWTKIKAVSSAVVRETPNVSKLVAKSETICPLPIFKTCATTRMTALALKLYRKQEVTSVVFPNQNLFDAAKVVMQSLGDIVDVLNQVESVPPTSATLRRNIISTLITDEDEHSDE